MSGIGETLREARRRRGHTLADAAASTRVRESHLAALEEEQFAALGGDVYVKGFLRSYARFLGVDADALLDRYRAEAGGGADTDAGDGAEPHRRTPRATRAVLAAIGAVVVVALLLAGLRDADAALVAAVAGAAGPA